MRRGGVDVPQDDFREVLAPVVEDEAEEEDGDVRGCLRIPGCEEIVRWVM